MTVEKIIGTEAAKQDAVREAWVKPEIASFEPISATQKASNPGDGTSNLS